MSFLLYIKIALRGLLANKSRSALTMLGIIIGIAAVIIVMSVGAGAQSLILNQVRSIGSNLITVFPGGSEEEGPPVSVMGIVITTLTYDDAQALNKKNNVPQAAGVAAYVQGVSTITWQNRNIDANFTGTTASYPLVEETEVAQGRFFDEREERSLERVVVLGSQVAKDLFLGIDPIGERVRIKKENFKVIGVMKQRGVSGFQNRDNQVFIPIITAQKLLLGIDYVSMIRIKVDEAQNLDQTVFDVSATLRERHDIINANEEDFTVRNTGQALEALLNITNALKFFLVAIAAISLIVGGIGIMNIMLVSVTERIKEIGLKKAVGATKSNILWEFLIESAAVSFIGGLFGIFIGAIISIMVALVARYLGYQWDLIISLSSILLASGVSMFVGIVFGFYPAKRAADFNPIDALRYE